MINKSFILTLFLIYTMGFGQKDHTTKKLIDSLSHHQWKALAVNLDSLEHTQVIDLNIKRKDSIIFKEAPHPRIVEESPITPYRLMHFKKEQQWFVYGQNNLIFNQSSFSQWNAGGENNIGILGKINYTLSYKKHKHLIENNIQLEYGLVSTLGKTTRKTEDYINISSNYGYDLGKNYYLSAGFQVLTQFAPGYNYAVTENPLFKDRISRFFAPAYFNLGVGISYNPVENFQVIFRPVNGKFTFVSDPLLQKKGRYGLERDGQNLRSELGAMLNVLYRLKIYKDISLVNQLVFFSNYSHHPERVDIAYNGLLSMKFNRFISTLVSLDLVYDHDQIRKLQLKQTLGVGISYHLGSENRDKLPKKKFVAPFVK